MHSFVGVETKFYPIALNEISYVTISTEKQYVMGGYHEQKFGGKTLRKC